MKPPEESGEPIGPRTWGILAVGLGLYGLGFLALSRDHPDLGPAVIVAGILVMLAAFLD